MYIFFNSSLYFPKPFIANLMKKYRFIFSLLLVGGPSFSQSVQCQDNLELLRQDLISMLNKMPAMPPIAQIYRPVRDLYDQAKDAANTGDYQTCVSKTELALKYSKPYGNRY